MRKLNPTALALLGVALLLLILWLFASRRSSDEDKLIGNVATEQAPQSAADNRCASKATYGLIKRELFRRADELRRSDQAVYERLAGYAVLRMENAVMVSEDREHGEVNCSGTLFLDLPPGVAVAGGRRSLTANIDYTLQQSADGDTVLQIPTNSGSELGNKNWGLGPSFVVLHLDHGDPWVYGVLVNNIWSLTSDKQGGSYNNGLIQPFVNYNFKEGLFLTSAPIITVDWKADSSQQWLVPIGGGVGKIFHVGRLPVNTQLSAYYNVVRPDFQANWQIRAQVQLMFPK